MTATFNVLICCPWKVSIVIIMVYYNDYYNAWPNKKISFSLKMTVNNCNVCVWSITIVIITFPCPWVVPLRVIQAHIQAHVQVHTNVAVNLRILKYEVNNNARFSHRYATLITQCCHTAGRARNSVDRDRECVPPILR